MAKRKLKFKGTLGEMKKPILAKFKAAKMGLKEGNIVQYYSFRIASINDKWIARNAAEIEAKIHLILLIKAPKNVMFLSYFRFEYVDNTSHFLACSHPKYVPGSPRYSSNLLQPYACLAYQKYANCYDLLR